MSDDILTARAVTVFQAVFGHAPTLAVQAPGRVNLIGEHTDYNDGLVLPCAIGYRTVIVARPRADRQLRVVAADYDGVVDTCSLDAPIERLVAPMWANYVRGVVRELLKQEDTQRPLHGMDLVIAGNVPQGAGLSSSASLSVAVGMLLATQPALQHLAPLELALAAQRAENDFVGCKCGNMDQISSACGVQDHALMIDCRSLDVAPVPVPAGAVIMIVESHIVRGLVDSAYNTRREQCEAAARHFGVAALRDVDLGMLQARGAGLDPVTWRRARHVVGENERVQAAATALAAGDLERLGVLMEASHASMRDDFEITVPAIDRLVTIIKAAIGPAGGVRMTGGGFGGCVVALLPEHLVEPARLAVERDYRAPDGALATVHVQRPAAGAGRVAIADVG